MALKDILVHVDPNKQGIARMDAAVNLAITHGAHLTGLYVKSHIPIPPYIQAQIGQDVLDMQTATLDRLSDEAEAAFVDKAKKADVPFEWRSAEGDIIEILNMNARYCDLAVIGQLNPEEGGIAADAGLPDRLILSMGRPALVVPYVGEYPVIGERVMVAWDGSRRATRAVNDALPLLKLAKKVSVMAVNPGNGPEGHGDVPGMDLAQHLARHKINAEAEHVTTDDIDIADMLLSRAADEGIDLFVMGAYGHARWRELVLGGVTQHMLEHMTMPVLMSH